MGSNFWNGASATANVEQSIKFGNGSNPLQEYAFVFGGTPSTGTKEYLFDQQVNLPHLVGSTGAPTVAAGTGAGTSPSLGVVSGSTDLSGYVTLTTGTTPIAPAAVLTLTFNVAYTVAPNAWHGLPTPRRRPWLVPRLHKSSGKYLERLICSYPGGDRTRCHNRL